VFVDDFDCGRQFVGIDFDDYVFFVLYVLFLFVFVFVVDGEVGIVIMSWVVFFLVMFCYGD